MKYINLAALSIFVITLASCFPKTQPVAATDHPQPVENMNTTEPLNHTITTDIDTGNQPNPVENTNEPFKYTITTDIDTKNENVEILVAINDVNGQYPVKYDLDCDSDGEYEYTGLTENQKCIYNKNSGTHQISVRGDIPGMFLCQRYPDVNCYESNAPSSKLPQVHDDSIDAVISVDSWGSVEWKSMSYFAAICWKLNKLPENSPNLTQVKDMSGMFLRANTFNQPLENWDVSNVTDMSDMFKYAPSFNQPLEKWNVSNVTNMRMMFASASSFNQPLDSWDVSNVTDMNHMFWSANFNQPLEKWDVSNVTNMNGMFGGASSFNQPLEKWDVSNVTDMHAMFARAKSFNQPLEKWDVSNVTDMSSIFSGASSFSHYPAHWIVPKDESEDMFEGTKVESLAKEKPLETR